MISGGRLKVQWGPGMAPDPAPVRVRRVWRGLRAFMGADCFVVGRSVYTRLVVLRDPVVRHELTHVRQYEAWGVAEFLWRYLTRQSFREAREAEAERAEGADWPRWIVVAADGTTASGRIT